MGPWNGLSWETSSFFCQCKPHRFLQLEVRFDFPGTETLGCVVCCGMRLLTPYSFLLVCIHMQCGTTWSTSHPFACILSVPAACLPTSLDECLFFNSLVGFPYNSIFWQFCFLVFFFFYCLLSFFWLFKEVKHTYLCLHLDHKLKVKFLSMRFKVLCNLISLCPSHFSSFLLVCHAPKTPAMLDHLLLPSACHLFCFSYPLQHNKYSKA